MRQHGGGKAGAGAVEPVDAVVAPEPRPLAAHITAGSDERQLTGPVDLGGAATRVERLKHLGVKKARAVTRRG